MRRLSRRRRARMRSSEVWRPGLFDGIDDSDDDGADGAVFALEDLAGAIAFVEDQDGFVGTGAGGVGRDEVAGLRLAVHRDFLDQQQALAVVEGVVDGGGDVADDASEDHWGTGPFQSGAFKESTSPMMAWSTGTNHGSSASAASRPPS